MTDQDQTPTGDGAQDQTPKGTAGDGGNTDVNLEEKFKASQSEAIKLRKEYDEYKKNHPDTRPIKTELPEEEKKFRELLGKYEQEKVATEIKEDEQLKSELDNLHTIHGEFDNTKLLSIVDRYGVYDDQGNVQWEKALELYERLGGVAEYEKKKPTGQRTSDKSPEADVIQNIGKKSMHEIINEGLRKFGIGG